MSALTAIWAPLEIGPVTVSNRIMLSAMTLGYGEDHILSDRHIAYYRERARGGVALLITEQQAGHRLSKGSFQMGCTAWEKRVIPQYARLAEAVHEFGAKQFVQLFGCGVHDKGTMIFDEWHPLWAASRIPSIVHREVPMVMEQTHIDDLVQGFGEAARNVEAAGLDGIEIQGAHSYLVGQFLSRAYNRRTDRYGGSPQARCRLAIELAQEIRGRTSPTIALGLRMSFDEFLDDAGITADEGEEQIATLADTGLFDYLSITAGGYHSIHKVTPTGTNLPEGYLVPFARRARRIVGDRLRIFIVGRIRRLEMAEDIISSGAADMVAMTRAHVADPYLIAKAREGRADEIVHCVYANVCQRRLWDQQPVACVVNPVAGREREWGGRTLSPAPGDGRRIAVVGGGPAGMKLGAIAAARGHRVTLYEQTAKLGGHLGLLAWLPTRETWADATDDLSRQLRHAGARVRVDVEASADMLSAGDFDTIVCATGARWDNTGLSPSRPDRDRIPGAERESVIDLGTAIARVQLDNTSLGSHVVIVDDSGSYLPLGLADVLAGAGVSVDVVSPHLFIGEDLQKTGDMAFLFPRLIAAGVRLRPQTFVERIDDDGVDIYGIWSAEDASRLQADSVVLALMRVPEDALYRDLRSLGEVSDIRQIGDCVAPRRLEAVMFESEQLGRAL